MKRIMFLVVGAVLLLAGPARAAIYEFPLPVTGEYPVHGGPGEVFKYFDIDLGQQFSEVHSARLRLTGSATAAVEPNYRWETFFNTNLQTDSGAEWTAYGPRLGLATFPTPEPFEALLDFDVDGAGDADFLLDGKVRAMVYLGSTRFAGGLPPPLVGSGTLTSATLILDAVTVPEPTGLLALLGTLALLRRTKHL